MPTVTSVIPSEAATPTMALLRRSSTAGVRGSTGGGWTAGREGSSDSTAISAKFTTGTKKSSAIQGLRPASTARRIVMLTPIQRNGSAIATSNGSSQGGAPRNSSARVLNNGDT